MLIIMKLKSIASRFMLACLLVFVCVVIAKADDDLIEQYNECQLRLLEYQENHEYQKGIAEGKEFLKQIERLEQGKKQHYASVLISIAYLFDDAGDHQNAIDYAAEAGNIYKRELSDTSSLYIANLNRIAGFYSRAEQYDNALSATAEARDLIKQKEGENSRSYSILTGNLATFYSNVGQLKKAIEMQQEALAIIERTQGKESLDYASTLGMLAVVQYRDGQTMPAIQNTKDALAILEVEEGKNTVRYMTFLNNLSTMQGVVGQYVDAMINVGVAKDICENLYGTESPMFAYYLNGYAISQADLGKNVDAIRTFSRALELRRQIYGDSHSDVASTMVSMGTCYADLGEYTEAIRFYKEASEIIAKTIGKESVMYAQTLNNMSVAYSCLGNFYEARRNTDEALQILSAILGDTNPTYASSLMSKASLEAKMGNRSTALELYDNALDIIKQTVGNNKQYASVLYNKAIAFGEMGQTEEAISLCEEALKIRYELVGRMHPDCVNTMCALGVFYAETGDMKTAVDYMSKAMSIAENAYGRKNPTYIAALKELCGMYVYDQNYSAASMNAIRCNELITDMVQRTFSDISSHERSLLWQKYSRWYTNVMPQIAVNTERKPVIQAAYNSLLFSKSLLLHTDIELFNMIAEEGNEDDLNLYQSMADARRQLTKVYELPVEKQKNMTDSIEAYLKVAESELLSRSKAYGDYTQKLRVSWDDVRQALGPKDVAIEFSSYYDIVGRGRPDSLRYVAFVLKSEYEVPHIIPICNVPYSGKLFKWESFENVKGDNLVWTPLADELDGVENIYFAPTGEFYSVPIEYMPYYGDKSQLMSDVFNIKRLSSTREIYFRKQRSDRQLATASLFGGLQYGTTQLLADGSEIRGDNVENDDIAILRDSFGPLPQTKIEVENISRYLNQMDVKYQLFTDSIGTETSFRNLSKQHLNLLHIATHGFYWTAQDAQRFNFKGFLNPNRFANFSDEDKALARSGILLAGAETTFQKVSDNYDPDDGIVTAKEIAQLDFRDMDLAVLSACQTGLGDISTDGVYGLQRGFKKAGVQTLLMSLWKVDDTATQLLMTNFYKGLSDGLSKVEALKSAQKFLREYEVEEEYDENDSLTASQRRRVQNSEGELAADIKLRKVKPYSSAKYWAAFVLLDALN